MLYRVLTQKRLTVAVAESCTGGQLAAALTRRSGSSGFFILGVVAYSNAAKQRLLGVPSRLLSRCGAVSEQAACSMARAVCRIAKSDFGVAVTGIAGPTGATRRKPVGTVFIAVSSREKTTCVHHRFKGTRSRVRAQAVRHALQFLLDATQQYST